MTTMKTAGLVCGALAGLALGAAAQAEETDAAMPYKTSFEKARQYLLTDAEPVPEDAASPSRSTSSATSPTRCSTNSATR